MYSPKEYALRLLKLRDRSEFEIRRKMVEKKYPSEDIDTTIAFLTEKRFIDDERFVRNFVRLAVGSGKMGKQKMQFKLSRFGIAKDLIGKELQEISTDSEYSRAMELANRWIEKKQSVPKEKIYERLGRFLLAKGFSYDIIKKVLDNYSN